MASSDRIRQDVGLIATVAAEGASGSDRYLSLVPETVAAVLDIGSNAHASSTRVALM